MDRHTKKQTFSCMTCTSYYNADKALFLCYVLKSSTHCWESVHIFRLSTKNYSKLSCVDVFYTVPPHSSYTSHMLPLWFRHPAISHGRAILCYLQFGWASWARKTSASLTIMKLLKRESAGGTELKRTKTKPFDCLCDCREYHQKVIFYEHWLEVHPATTFCRSVA